MPTLRPNPVEKPKDELEQMARMGAIGFIEKFFRLMYDWSYSTRSHMPGGLDFTDFTDALNKLLKFCKARPDWTLEIVNKALADFGPGAEPQCELDRLRAMVKNFEESSGLKLGNYKMDNYELARAVKIVIEAGGIERIKRDVHEKIDHTIQGVRRTLKELELVADRIK